MSLISIMPMNGVFKALAHPLRREIIEMLRLGPLTSGQIATSFAESWPTITGHLAVLREAGLVDSERDGTQIRYRLVISAIEEGLAFLLKLSSESRIASRPRERKTAK